MTLAGGFAGAGFFHLGPQVVVLDDKVRQKLIETGHVEAMIAIRGQFFYTRTVPCELWLLDKAKPAQHTDTVLMLDARQVFRKMKRKIFDFAPEQLQNFTAILWLYRGEQDRFRALVAAYLDRALAEARDEKGMVEPWLDAMDDLIASLDEADDVLTDARAEFQADWHAHFAAAREAGGAWLNGALPVAEKCMARMTIWSFWLKARAI